MFPLVLCGNFLTLGVIMSLPKNKKILFRAKCLENPRSMGAVAPSSPVLAKKMAQCAAYVEGNIVVELGAGTGALTKGLLDHGVQTQDLFPVEIDPFLAGFLQKKFPELAIISGNAAELSDILPKKCASGVDIIISSLPLVNFTKIQKEAVVDSCFDVLKPKGRLLQYTYGMTAPIPYKEMGLKGRRMAFVLFNLPPAFIWEFSK